ncbi:MAG TPA: WD40 repeat domain-containing protein, partial [Pyrinomonadaceae bacterium]|nr:WD40 repeat domain-containing protein [Pyrinomonadaceae bacterium]
MQRLSALPVLWLALALVAGAQAVRPGDPILVIDPGGHTRFVKDVVFTADGRQLVSGGDDKVIRVWDVAAGKTVRTIRGQLGPGAEGTIYALALSPDNKYLAVGGIFPGAPDEGFAIRLHDFESGRVIDLLKGHEMKVNALAFSADGRRLVSGSDDKRVLVWDVSQAGAAGGAAVAPLEVGRHGESVSAVAFSPDGTMVASGGDDAMVDLWNARKEAQGARLLGQMTRHGYEQVYGVAFSPDGRYVVSGGLDDRVFLWDWKGVDRRSFSPLNGGTVRELLRMSADVLNVAFSPDGA